MPKRKKAAEKSAVTRRNVAGQAGAMREFVVGDVVLDAGDPDRVGRVCRVETAGRSYQVRFAASPVCMLTPHAAIVLAPPLTQGPDCTPDC